MANPGPKHPFYAEHVGDRLAPEIASVYKQWSGLEGKELVQHLHTIVSDPLLLGGSIAA